MSIIERTVLMTNKDANGNTTMDFPITKVENVEGAASLKDLENIEVPVRSVNGQTGDVNIPVPSDMTDYIIESYRNGTEWYEVYKSGKVRQGGQLVQGSHTTAFATTFLKPFANNKYTLTIGYSSSTDEPCYKRYIGWCSKTTTNFTAWANHGNKDWIAEGQGA